MKRYRPVLTATENRKGVLDVDTVKGCTLGMRAYPDGGCYGVCYACKLAKLYGYDFSCSVSRNITGKAQVDVERAVMGHSASWFRIGTMGDPCHNWDLTLAVCEWLGSYLLFGNKVPVVITKHWKSMSEEHLDGFVKCGTVFNTSISALDTDCERQKRLEEHWRLRDAGVHAYLRIVSCRFGETNLGRHLEEVQKELFRHKPYIDNPLRIPSTDERVEAGHILVERRKDLAGKSTVSISNRRAYLGRCENCPDLCGLAFDRKYRERSMEWKLDKRHCSQNVA